MSDAPSVQRSFRLSAATAEFLDREAEAANESRNALAERLLAEALRQEHHPLVRFQRGAAGRRQPLLTGTRLYIHQVIATLREHGGSVPDTAAYFSLPPSFVRAALDYYADYRDEVDADAAVAERVAEAERAHLERQQRALA
jgi:uncharacterized protein (DUF433 family)